MSRDVTLTYDARDTGKVFKKPQWSNDIMFSWSEQAGYYGYCVVVTDDGEDRLVFKAPYHPENKEKGYRVSKVGQGVLESGLVLVVDFNKKKKVEEVERNVDYIGGKYNVVSVRFLDDGEFGTLYTFKIDADLIVEEGALAVVESKAGLGLVRIVKYHERNMEIKTMKIFNKAKAWVVALVDESRQKQRREANDRRKFIMKQLEEKKQAMEEVEIYKVLAAHDSEAAELIKELEDMGTRGIGNDK